MNIQNQIVVSLAELISIPWNAAFADIEIDDIDGFQNEDGFFNTLAKVEDGWKETSIMIPRSCSRLFGELRNAMSLEEGMKWTVCTVEFNSAGKYRYSFSYDSPPRINGNFDDQKFKNYVPPEL